MTWVVSWKNAAVTLAMAEEVNWEMGCVCLDRLSAGFVLKLWELRKIWRGMENNKKRQDTFKKKKNIYINFKPFSDVRSGKWLAAFAVAVPFNLGHVCAFMLGPEENGQIIGGNKGYWKSTVENGKDGDGCVIKDLRNWGNMWSLYINWGATFF